MITKPMLAASIDDFSKLDFPYLCTPKMDGIRALRLSNLKIRIGRDLKILPNKYTRNTIVDYLSQWPDVIFDGELTLNTHGRASNFQSIVSAFRTEEGEPDFIYNIFDYVFNTNGYFYTTRVALLEQWFYKIVSPPKWLRIVVPSLCSNQESLDIYENDCIQDGYEGVMLRKEEGLYKCGRSTFSEGGLIKLKRFQDGEAKLIGKEQLIDINGNTREELGALIVQNSMGTFNIGTGFTTKQRKILWVTPVVGQKILFKYQAIGTKDVPRCPVFKAII